MNLNNVNKVYFLGIGGIGMSALARYFIASGKEVCGYDKTPTKLTDELIAEGMKIHFEDNISCIPENFKSAIDDLQSEILIVYTPAIPKEHAEFVFFKSNAYILKKRAEVLGLITAHSKSIAVAGTHGKTTTSSLIAHILKFCNVDCSAFLGGITKNYHTNLLLSKHLSHNSAPLVVVEADEYDRSFLTLFPDIAVITSLDADHLDIYGDKKYMEESYSLFSRQVTPPGTLIIKKSIEPILNHQRNALTYSLNPGADFFAKNLQIKNGQYVYDVVSPIENLTGVTLGLPGSHNVENSIAAIAVAQQFNIPGDLLKSALSSFMGVNRRFDYQIKSENLVFIDDYAHHPEELKACINSVRELYPDKKITGIFQPHLFSRTRDFADEFALSLALLDELILLEIYPARELPIEGINSAMLLDKVNMKNKMICSKANLVNEIGKRKPEVLLTLGAGDIDMFVEPLKNKLLKFSTES